MRTNITALCSDLNDLTVRALGVLCGLDDQLAHVLVQLPHSHGVCGETVNVSLRRIGALLHVRLNVQRSLCTFGTLGHRDDAVWEVHKHIKQVRSVAHFWIHKSCYVSCRETRHIGV